MAFKKITVKSKGNLHTVTFKGEKLYFDTIGKALAAVHVFRAMFYMEGLKNERN